MNKDKMLAWAEALESGQYKQCHDSWGRGKTDRVDFVEGFCCLHVALDLEGKQAYYDSERSFIQNTYDITYEDIDYFICLNDEQELSFPEIAQHIRSMVAES